MTNLNLSAPWNIYRNKLAAMFEHDNEVDVSDISEVSEGNSSELEITVRVETHAKADALIKLLKPTVHFGGVSVHVNVVEANTEETPESILKAAFSYNPVINFIDSYVDDTNSHHTFAVFEPGIVQFFADDLSDYYGNFNALYEDVARELFVEMDGTGYSTALLDEWE